VPIPKCIYSSVHTPTTTVFVYMYVGLVI